MQSNHNFQKTRREANERQYDDVLKMQQRKRKPSRFVPRQGWEA